MTNPSLYLFTLRTVCVTDTGWISMTATTLEDDEVTSVDDARKRNLRDLHRKLAVEPPKVATLPTAWEPPDDLTKVTLSETLIKQDPMTGESVYERDLADRTLLYQHLNRD